MIRLATFAAALMAATSAQADIIPDRINFLFGSHHVNAAYQLEEFNPGIGLTWEFEHIDAHALIYRNSFGNISTALMASYTLAAWDDFTFEAFAGVARYPGENAKPAPTIPNWSYHNPYAEFATQIGESDWIATGGLMARHASGPFMQIMPGDGKDVKAIIAFGVSLDLN